MPHDVPYRWVAKLYKVTDQWGRTGNGIEWGPYVTHRAAGAEGCGEGWLYACPHPLVAVMLYPFLIDPHRRPRLWEAVCAFGDVIEQCGGLAKCRELTTIREIPWPTLSPEDRACFAILCALAVPHDSAFGEWAEAWLSGANRSAEAALRIALTVGIAPAAYFAARAAEWATKQAATWRNDVAWAAAHAARAAAASADSTLDLGDLAEQSVPPEILATLPRVRAGRAPAVEDMAADLRSQQGPPGITIENAYHAASQTEDADVKNVVYRDEGGTPIGILRIFLNAAGEPELASVAVVPAHRRTGRGVAVRLAQAAEAAGFDLESAAGMGGYTPEGAVFARRYAAFKRRLLNRAEIRHRLDGVTAGT